MLSRRENDVIRLAAQGLSAKASAHRLGIAEVTVNLYLTFVRRKLGAKNTTEAAVKWAMKNAKRL